ncbi:uncharacterized protein LOC133795572 [Humulus lupulus]|uniref:uncharacterized protein LOC133795572 n=1 Tax=Humulus lupulus TaxID=3486 RepID=UPI002B4065B6|nr:uncharacterized protein LOC133795572 [Humulus lupulus]
MAKGVKMQGKAKASVKKKKKKGPTSSDGRREEVWKDFSTFLQASQKCFGEIASGKNPTPPILRSDHLVQNLNVKFQRDKEQEGQRDMKIGLEDIEDEIEFWSSSLVCYVLGANPPLSVLEGFARRVWKTKGVDKVGILNQGVFIIRFDSTTSRDEFLQGGFRKENVRVVPTWIQLNGLELKYWGERSLFKIVSQIGKPLQVDEITKNRDRLNYPRILIEVSLTQDFPYEVSFTKEFDQKVVVDVFYEWKPVLCGHCKGYGHITENCRKKDGRKKEWVIKKDNNMAQELEKEKGVMVDEEGFQQVTRSGKLKMAAAPPTIVANSFDVLSSEVG